MKEPSADPRSREGIGTVSMDDTRPVNPSKKRGSENGQPTPKRHESIDDTRGNESPVDTPTVSSRRFKVINETERGEYFKVAMNLWLEHTTDVPFSQAQTDLVVKFAASAMAYATGKLGIDLKAELDGPLKRIQEAITKEISGISDKIGQQLE